MVMERDPRPMNIEFLIEVVKVLQEFLLLKKMGKFFVYRPFRIEKWKVHQKLQLLMLQYVRQSVTKTTFLAKIGQKWSKMVKNGQKLPKIAKNGKKWTKMDKK